MYKYQHQWNQIDVFLLHQQIVPKMLSSLVSVLGRLSWLWYTDCIYLCCWISYASLFCCCDSYFGFLDLSKWETFWLLAVMMWEENNWKEKDSSRKDGVQCYFMSVIQFWATVLQKSQLTSRYIFRHISVDTTSVQFFGDSCHGPTGCGDCVPP